MYTTYRNDLMDAPYPLYGDCALPFPSSVLIGMSLCLREAVSASPVTLNYLHVDASVVYGVLYFKDLPLCEFTVDRSMNKTSASVIRIGDIPVIGSVTIGSIPEGFSGTYTGVFKVDPSCVTYTKVPATIGDSGEILDEGYDSYSRYGDIIWINGIKQDAPAALRIAASGIASTAQNAEVSVSAADLGTDWLDYDDTAGDTYIESINGQSVRTSSSISGITLEFEFTESVAQKLGLYPMVKTNSGDIVITLCGTTAFPNCYHNRYEFAPLPDQL